MAKKIKKPAATKNKNKGKTAPKSKAAKPTKTKAIKTAKAVKKPVKAKIKPAKKVKTPAKVAIKKPNKSSKENKASAKKTPTIKDKKTAKEVVTKSLPKTYETKIPESKTSNKVEKKFSGKSAKSFIIKTAPSSKVKFNVGDYAIYPSHGVGKIASIEKTMIIGEEKSCYLMYFEKERLSIKIPVSSSEQIGLRHPITKSQMDEVFVILRSGVKKLKGMWSRRAQEYETKINSGDIMLLAEVIRDLTRDIEDSERSYSERIIYETAIYRLTSEYVVIYGTAFDEAKEIIINTAKDKLGTEGKVIQKDDFDDEFDAIEKKRNSSEDEEEEDEDEEEDDEDEDGDDEDDDYDYDDDDDAPRKKRKK